ncbi:MAG: hypothetical protein IJ821_06275, partial [Lachnospiraceae bacterium]|nr:hypothetical protein [Lachnospiraceae bacterium]
DDDFINWLEEHGVELTDDDLKAMGLERKDASGDSKSSIEDLIIQPDGAIQNKNLHPESGSNDTGIGKRNNQIYINPVYKNKHKDAMIQSRKGNNHTDHIRDRQRKNQRNISDKAIESVIRNPLHKTNVEYDEFGRPFVKYIGNKITVVVNPDTGALVTVRRTTKQERNRWKKKRY